MYVWATFDLVVFKVILGSFGVLVSKWPVIHHRAKRIEIWDPTVVVICVWGTYNFLVFKVILGSFREFVYKWPCKSKMAGRRVKQSEI